MVRMSSQWQVKHMYMSSHKLRVVGKIFCVPKNSYFHLVWPKEVKRLTIHGGF